VIPEGGEKRNTEDRSGGFMTKKGKKLSVYISLGVIPFGAATVELAVKANHVKRVSSVDATQETDAAFRDGLYLGKLDAEGTRKVRPSIGRWNGLKDRASFLAGYQRGYEETRTTKIAGHHH
jgi:hypothetical protein